MTKQTVVLALTGALLLASIGVEAGEPVKAPGKQKGEVKADSMVYDQPTEWRVFSVDGPATAFALAGDNIWMSTDKLVASIGTKSTKKSDVQRLKALGTMSTEGIRAIAADKEGNVWFGGPNGLAQKKGSAITVYSADNGLSDNNVSSIAIAGDGSVWVGTEVGLSVYTAGMWKKYSVKEGLVSDKIQCIITDCKGAVWVGTDKGISVYSAGKWTTHSMKNNMSWNDTKALACDPKTGMVWAAVGEKDVNSFDGKTWNVYMEIQAGTTSIMIDSQGRIWFGSETGLVKFNGDEWVSDPKKLGVPAAQIKQMYKDPDGNLWFAMENGVVRLANPYPY